MKIELLFLGVSLVSGFTAGPSRSLSSVSSYSSSFSSSAHRRSYNRLRIHLEPVVWSSHHHLRKHARFNSRLPASTASSSVTPLSSSKGVIESDTNLGSVEATNTIQVINNHTSKNNSCMKHKTYMDQQKGQNRIRSSNRKQNKQTRENPTSDTDFLMKRTLQITSKHERFASYTESSILRSVHWLLDAWNRMDTTTNKIEYNVKLASVQSLFDSLEELYHVKPTTKTWTRLIKAYGQEKGGHHAMDILHQMPTSERNVHCYAEVLDCFAHEIMMVQSEARYNQNGAIGTFPSSSSSSNHTKSLAKVAQDVLQQMIDNDNLPRPNARCFHAVIRAWGHEYNPPAAQACMSLMQTLYSQGKIDEPPNRYCYNAVIYAWANSGHEWNAEMAEALLNQMSKDVHPNIVSYNLCIAAWAKTGNGERAENILRTMDSNESDHHPNHCKPNTMTYNSVMNAYAKSSDAKAAEKAEKLLSEMKKRVEEEGDDCSVRPDFFSFSTVINAWARSLNSEKVYKVMNILNEMETDYNIRPNGTFDLHHILRTMWTSTYECLFSILGKESH
jgi:hypothetical protein